MRKIHLSTGLLYFLQKVLTYHALYQRGHGVSTDCILLIQKNTPENGEFQG